jgi:hypothetical protein
MKNKGGHYLLVLVAFVLSCADKSMSPDQYGLQGSWRLYEEGGSPGFGYFVTQVPAEPVQSLTFTNKGQILSKGERFNSFGSVAYYRIDSTSVGPRLTLSTEPTGKPFLGGSFRIRADTLRINPVCYEGCHYGLVRMR